MSTPSDTVDSRRGFLTRVLAAAATAGAGAASAVGAPAAGGRDVVRLLRIGGVQIAPHVIGGVVFRGEAYDYLLFDACRPGGAAAGVAVVRLTRCAAWRIRLDGDQNCRGWAADPSGLEECETYEVHNSGWVVDLIDDSPALGRPGASPLHHLVFTFREAHFECVVSRYDLLVYTGSFGDLVKRLAAGGL